MKTRWLLLTTLAAIGCTSPPVAEDLELEELEARWTPSYAAIPDAEPSVDEPPAELADEALPTPPALEREPGQPWIVVGRYDWTVTEDSISNGEYYGGESALCPFDVYASGFPAVTVEGDLLVESISENVSPTEGEDEVMTVTWHRVDDDAVEHGMVVYDGGDGWDDSYHRHCRNLYNTAKAQAEQANRRLAARRWRSMQPMGTFIHDSDNYDYDPEYREQILATPSWKRPAELIYGSQQAVVRVPGVKVLARAEIDWGGADDEYCDPFPHVREIWGDEQTGAVAVYLDHQSGACLCYSDTEIHTLRWPEAAFVASEREAQPRDALLVAARPVDEA